MFKKVISIALTVVCFVWSGQVAYAQEHGHQGRQRQSFYNLNERDRASIAKTRDKMQVIRQNEHRPTVGLVLSGGGAKGAAHIGVLRFLEENHIPVDIITGTSMGTLMGALYCVGYTPDEMEEMINSADWDMLLQDEIPAEYFSIEKRKYDASVVLNMPFYRGKVGEKVQLGMPSSLVQGRNTENYFASKLTGYTSDDLDFADLDIPLGCIATNITDARARVFLNGNMITAARSSMSIPGLFAPKVVDGKTLVDGGMIDNFPAALAKQMGADIVIGVDLSSNLNEKEIEDIGGVLGAMIDLAETPRHRVNTELCDVIIYPDVVKEFNMLSFDKESITEIIKRGYVSGQVAAAALDSTFAARGLTLSEYYHKDVRHAVDIEHHGVEISSFELRGITNDFDRKYFLGLMDIYHTQKVVDKAYLDDIVARIYARGAFQSVTYELRGDKEPYALIINCVPGKLHQIGVGLRLDSEEVATIDLHAGYNTHKLSGNKLDANVRISVNPQIKFHWALDVPRVPTINATVKVRWTSTNILKYDDAQSKFNRMSYFNTNAKIYLSNFKGKKVNFELGGAYDFNMLINRLNLEGNSAICEGIGDRMNNWKVFADFQTNTLDAEDYPRRGVRFGMGYEFNIRPRMVHAAYLNLVVPLSFGTKIFTLTPGLYSRVVFGQTYENTPLFVDNAIGGEVAGRYLDQQVEFTGINTMVDCGNVMGLLRLDARFMVFKNTYVSARANYVVHVRDIEAFSNREGQWHNDIFGCGVEGAYVNKFGIIKGVLSFNTLTKRVGFYASIGKCF